MASDAVKAELRGVFEPHLKANPGDEWARAFDFALCVLWKEPRAAEWHLRALGGKADWFTWGDLTFAGLIRTYAEIGGRPVPVAGKK